ncbi:MAG: 30S ribosomal protein S3, partial [Bacteroidota bacterium]
MGQKANPISLRLGYIRGWDSNWFGGSNYADKLVEDENIRSYVKARLPKGSISKIII